MTAKDMSQVMYEKLKCQVCETGPTAGKSQWYQCLSHHQICQDCKTAELTKCPCGRMISSDHCSLNEELLKLTTMRFKCKNTKNGCKETLSEEAMISHQIDCIYRLVKCPRIVCGTKVPFHELLEHMNQKSDIFKSYDFIDGKMILMTHELSKKNFENGNFSLIPVKIANTSETFFIMLRVVDGTFYQWVHFLGSTIEAKNYVYTLEYIGTDDSERSNIYKARVVSIDETKDSIIENSNCLSMPFRSLKAHFVDQDRNFRFSLKIWNMKEEVKDENVESGISDDDE